MIKNVPASISDEEILLDFNTPHTSDGQLFPEIFYVRGLRDTHFWVENWYDEEEEHEVCVSLSERPTVREVLVAITESLLGSSFARGAVLRREVGTCDENLLYCVGDRWWREEFANVDGHLFRSSHISNQRRVLLNDDSEWFPVAGGLHNHVILSPVGTAFRVDDRCSSEERKRKICLSLTRSPKVGEIRRGIAAILGLNVGDILLHRDVGICNGTTVYRACFLWWPKFADARGKLYNLGDLTNLQRKLLDNDNENFPITGETPNHIIVTLVNRADFCIENSCHLHKMDLYMRLTLPAQPRVRQVRRSIASALKRAAENTVLGREIGVWNWRNTVYLIGDYWWTGKYADSTGNLILKSHEINNKRRECLLDKAHFPVTGGWRNHIIVTPTGVPFLIENRYSGHVRMQTFYLSLPASSPTVGDVISEVGRKLGRPRPDFVIRRVFGLCHGNTVYAVSDCTAGFSEVCGKLWNAHEVENEMFKLLCEETDVFPIAGEWTQKITVLSADSFQTDSWRKIGYLGGGGFGEVYLCEDNRSRMKFAMKKVSTNDNEKLVAMDNEIQLLSSLRHDNIVKYLGSWNANGMLSIFIQYMPGGSLLQEIISKRSLTEAESSRYTRQVLEGLQFLHQNGIIHRDIKPSNILSDGEGNVKLSDFGISRQIGRKDNIQQVELPRIRSLRRQRTVSTSAKTNVGTVNYMAPEVIYAANNRKYNTAADVWSLACTVVEMITGEIPWFQENPDRIAFLVAFQKESPALPVNISSQLRDFFNVTFIYRARRRATVNNLLNHPFCRNT